MMGWLSRLLFSSPRSPKWKGVRKGFLKKNGKCEACGTRSSLEVHHIFPYHLFPELELEEGNLMTLCDTCHFVFGHLKDWTSYNRDVRLHTKWYRGKRDGRP